MYKNFFILIKHSSPGASFVEKCKDPHATFVRNGCPYDCQAQDFRNCSGHTGCMCDEGYFRNKTNMHCQVCPETDEVTTEMEYNVASRLHHHHHRKNHTHHSTVRPHKKHKTTTEAITEEPELGNTASVAGELDSASLGFNDAGVGSEFGVISNQSDDENVRPTDANLGASAGLGNGNESLGSEGLVSSGSGSQGVQSSSMSPPGEESVGVSPQLVGSPGMGSQGLGSENLEPQGVRSLDQRS